jgi:queuine tRNA-ribosyltransferase
MNFKIEKKLDKFLGRAGVLTTSHGIINTPAFVPVGTKATIKSLVPEQVAELGAQIILANTYHLYLQPGDELIAKAGGLHKFMNWDGPMITDSGGFQVFSLGAAYGKDFSKIIRGTEPTVQIPERSSAEDGVPRLATIGNDGVSFRSHIDGSLHYITPEKSIQIQHNLGADIIFAFDEATSPHENYAYQDEALSRTHAWAKRSLEEHQRLSASPDAFAQSLGPSLRSATPSQKHTGSAPPLLFGIVQGGLEPDLRKKSAEYISSLPFDGFGIGGSYTKEDMEKTTKLVNEILPEEKPRHLLGIGEPEDLFMGVENGVDLFDCVAPTRIARNGTLYTKNGKINIMNTQYRDDFSPIEDGCGCYTCGGQTPPSQATPPLGRGGGIQRGLALGSQGYSRAYLAHLFHAKEMLAATLASIHNVYFIVNLVKNIRQSILDENFFEFKEEFLGQYLKK